MATQTYQRLFSNFSAFQQLLANIATCIDLFKPSMYIPIITNYNLQQHRRSSVVVEWYKKCGIKTASSTVLLGITRAYTYKMHMA